MKQYFRAIPARGTHPGALSELGEVFEHDPRGYHPDWQTGWQRGYTDGYRHRLAAPRSDPPSGVLDDDQYSDGYAHGRNVGVYHRFLTHPGMVTQREVPGVPSPWWRSPDPDNPEGYQDYSVQIEVTADAATPRDAAERAWDGIINDAPPVVSVWPTLGSPADAVEIDLSADHDEEPA